MAGGRAASSRGFGRGGAGQGLGGAFERLTDGDGVEACLDPGGVLGRKLEAEIAAIELLGHGQGRAAAAEGVQHDVAGVGVAAAGLVDPDAGLIIEVNDAPALHGYPVTERLRALTGVPVRVEHRARLQVLGDRWFGAGRGRRVVRFQLHIHGARLFHS